MSNQIQILHVGPASRSTRVPWLLEELDADIQKKFNIKAYSLFKPEEYRTDEFKAKYSPNAKFPVLVEGDLTLLEGTAINSYILRAHASNSPLLPKDLKDLAIYDSVNAFLVGHVDEIVISAVDEAFFGPPKEQQNVELIANEKKKFDEEIAEFFNRRLAKNEYIVNNTFTAADINVCVTLFLANLMGWLDHHPKLLAYYKRVISRPSWVNMKIEEAMQTK